MKRNQPEDGLQGLCFAWLRLQRPDVFAFAIPNGGKRAPREAARLKKLGVTAGVADICILHQRIRTGFIELKIRPNKLTDAQVVFRDECKHFGIPWAECTSFEEFQGTINAWCGRRDVPSLGADWQAQDSRANYSLAIEELRNK